MIGAGVCRPMATICERWQCLIQTRLNLVSQAVFGVEHLAANDAILDGTSSGFSSRVGIS
jgi:hypothetical protein